MKPLSPLDAISPSFSRMRSILLPPGPTPGLTAPFRFWFFFKMTLVGAFTESGFYSASILFFFEGLAFAVFTGLGRGLRNPAFETSRGLTTALLFAGIFGGAIALAIWIFLGWLWCRLRFSLFDLVLFRHGRVGVAWARYGAPAWRFLGLTILVTLAFLLVLGLTAGPFVLHLVLTMRHLTPQQINADPFLIIGHVLPLYGLLFGGILLVAVVDAILQDFLLPPMAIEDAPVEDSVGRFFHLLRNRTGVTLIYLLLRFGLQFGLSAAGGIVVFIILGVLVSGGVGFGFVLHHAFAHAGPGGFAIFVLYCVVAALIVAFIYFLTLIFLHGTIAVFRQSYAQYFYGSHYPLLGNYLEPDPSAPPSVSPPPLLASLAPAPEPPPIA